MGDQWPNWERATFVSESENGGRAEATLPPEQPGSRSILTRVQMDILRLYGVEQSAKRVATAIGEGSMAVRLAFDRLEAIRLAMADLPLQDA